VIGLPKQFMKKKNICTNSQEYKISNKSSPQKRALRKSTQGAYEVKKKKSQTGDDAYSYSKGA
jgi:hypothetical protein